MFLKAKGINDSSKGIVVSFHSKWQQILQEGKLRYVFRKRGPARMIPQWIYVYCGTPVKALIGRLPVKSLKRITVSECLKLAEYGAISENDLSNYAKDYNTLFVFEVGQYISARKAASLDQLNADYGFLPPQSFLILSEEGVDAVDKHLF